MKFKLIFLTFLFFISSCGNKYDDPKETCLDVWKAMSTLDMETIQELSTEDSYFALAVLEGLLKKNGFYYFMRTFDVVIESDALSSILNEKNIDCEIMDNGEAKCYFRQPNGLVNKKYFWKFRKEDGIYKFIVGMYLIPKQ